MHIPKPNQMSFCHFSPTKISPLWWLIPSFSPQSLHFFSLVFFTLLLLNDVEHFVLAVFTALMELFNILYIGASETSSKLRKCIVWQKCVFDFVYATRSMEYKYKTKVTKFSTKWGESTYFSFSQFRLFWIPFQVNNMVKTTIFNYQLLAYILFITDPHKNRQTM